jgi:hypothetical protein
MKTKLALLALSLLLTSVAWSAGFLDREIYFSEADIQAQVEKSGTMQKSYGNGLIVVSFIEAPESRWAPLKDGRRYPLTSIFHCSATQRSRCWSKAPPGCAMTTTPKPFSGQSRGAFGAVTSHLSGIRADGQTGHYAIDDLILS